MRIHAIQTGTFICKRRQLQSVGEGFRRRFNMMLDTVWTEPLPIYCWVIEHPEGIIVVDTGETARVAEPGYLPSWHPYYRFNVRWQVRPEDEIGPQLRTLGIRPEDVRWLVMTHLHGDHADGLQYFPTTKILVSEREYEIASGLPGRMGGYLPHRWPTWFAPQLINWPASPFGPFPSSYPLTQAGDVLLLPTPGHTPGHLSVLVREGSTNIFLAGDTSYTQQLLLDNVVDGVSGDDRQYRQTLHTIRQFLQETPTVYLPSHDAASVQRLADRTVM